MTTPIEIDDSEERVPSRDSLIGNPLGNSPVHSDLSISSDIVAQDHSVCSEGYVDKEEDIPLSSLLKKVKKRKVASVQDVSPETTKGATMEKNEGVVPQNSETQGCEKGFNDIDTFQSYLPKRCQQKRKLKKESLFLMCRVKLKS